MNKCLVVSITFFFSVMCSQVTLADDLNLSKSDGISPDECVASGEDIVYTICYSNPNPDKVENVILTDTLPVKTTFKSADNNGVYDDKSHSVKWDLGSLEGEAEEACVELKVNATARPGAVLNNQAAIDIDSSEEPTEVAEKTDICPVQVNVDIKPGGCPTPVNVNSKGVLPVAVLGTSTFDVSTIAPGSITLAGVSPLRWSMEDVATPYQVNVNECDIYDCHELTGDDYVDLTLKFDSQEIYAAIGEVYDRDCLILELTGKLKAAHGDLPIKGGDVVSILKKKKPNVVPANSLLLKK